MVLEARDLTNFLIQLKGHCKRIMYIVLKLPVYLKQGQKLTIRTQINVVIQSEILKVRKLCKLAQNYKSSKSTY